MGRNLINKCSDVREWSNEYKCISTEENEYGNIEKCSNRCDSSLEKKSEVFCEEDTGKVINLEEVCNEFPSTQCIWNKENKKCSDRQLKDVTDMWKLVVIPILLILIIYFGILLVYCPKSILGKLVIFVIVTLVVIVLEISRAFQFVRGRNSI